MQEIRRNQFKDIELQLTNLKCSSETLQLLEYREKSLKIISDELQELDDLLLSLNYRFGLHPKIFHLYVTSCKLAVGNSRICRDLIRAQKFDLKVDKVIVSNDQVIKIIVEDRQS